MLFLMKVRKLTLQGPKVLMPSLYRDQRGFFLEGYRKDRYKEVGVFEEFVQDNHSYSIRGTIRGMHFQRSPGQAKIIRVIVGEIYDVVVDVRPNSPTFGKWEGVYLDDQSCYGLYIPVGFAHGFCVLKDAHVFYKVSSFYVPEEEQGFRYDDPKVGIKWPIQQPTLSKRDQEALFFDEATHLM